MQNIPLLHAMDGLPKYPGMHLHTPLWFLGRQRAFNPQLTSEHAGTQLPCEHFWSNWQSKSDSH